MDLSHRWRQVRTYYRKGGFAPLVGAVTETTLGRNLYLEYLSHSADDTGFIRRSVGEFDVLLDPADDGISHTLLHLGEWESTILETYREALTKHRSQQGAHVLDVGANRGYFAFHAATTLPDATIHAIEPVPRNLAALRGGIEANGLMNVEPYQLAIGKAETTRSLSLSTHSNLHTIAEVPSAKRPLYTGETLDVEVQPLDWFLTEHDIDPSSVVGVRFDIEGAEHRLLQGAQRLLEAAGSLVVFAEVHPHRLPEGATESILDTFESAGFAVAGATSRVTPTLHGYDDLRHHVQRDGSNSAAEIVFTRD